MSERLTKTGASYRTKLFRDEGKARRFAACLAANSRFAFVTVIRSERSRVPSWFVEFSPSSESRATALLQRQQDARAQRLMTISGVHGVTGRFVQNCTLSQVGAVRGDDA